MNGSSRNVFTTYFDVGASHRPAWVTPRAAEWLADNLHFANWSRRNIAHLPTIQIAAWAAANKVYLNKSAMRADRDGGLVAIDANVPKLTPEQLSVLPMSEWQEHRNEFVYSSWVRAAMEDAKSTSSSSANAAR